MTALLAVIGHLDVQLSNCASDFKFFETMSARATLLRENELRYTMAQAGASDRFLTVEIPTVVELNRMSMNETMPAYDKWLAATVGAGQTCRRVPRWAQGMDQEWASATFYPRGCEDVPK